MPELSHLLTSASSAEIGRLQALLDDLLAARAVQALPDLPAALARLQADAAGRPAAVDGTEPRDTGLLPGARPETSAMGLAAFGAANALLLQEPMAAPATVNAGNGSGPLPGLALRADFQGGPGVQALVAAPGAAPALATEADWGALGAQDHAVLSALQDAGGWEAVAAAVDYAVAGTEFAGADASPLAQAIARIDAQIESVAREVAFHGEPVSPAEIAAGAQELDGQPLPALLEGTRDAATSYGQQVGEAVDLAPIATPDDVLPDVATTIEVVDGAHDAVTELAGQLTDVLGQVGTDGQAPGTIVPVLGLVTDVLDDGASVVADLLPDAGDVPAAWPDVIEIVPDTLEAVTDVVVDVVDGVADVVVDVTDAVTGVVADVTETVAEVVTTVGDTVAGIVGDTVDVVTDALQDTVDDVLSPLPDVVAGVGDVVVDVVDGVAGAVPILQPVADLTEEVVTRLDDVVEDVTELVTDVLDGAFDAVDTTTEVVVDVVQGATDALGDVTGQVGDLVGGLLGGGGTAAPGLADLVAGVLSPPADAPAASLLDTLAQGDVTAVASELVDGLQDTLAALPLPLPLPLLGTGAADDAPASPGVLPSLGAVGDDASSLLAGLGGLVKPGG